VGREGEMEGRQEGREEEEDKKKKKKKKKVKGTTKKEMLGRALVAHASNPSYSGGRNQEDHGSKPAQGNCSARPYLKNRTGFVAQGEGPEFKAPVPQKKKNVENKEYIFVSFCFYYTLRRRKCECRRK
jgi:hypothetical protein